MSSLLRDKEEFEGSIQGIRTVVIVIGTGTATLKALGQNSVGTVVPVPVPDGSFSASTVFSFNTGQGLIYHFALTGDATVTNSR